MRRPALHAFCLSPPAADSLLRRLVPRLSTTNAETSHAPYRAGSTWYAFDPITVIAAPVFDAVAGNAGGRARGVQFDGRPAAERQALQAELATFRSPQC